MSTPGAQPNPYQPNPYQQPTLPGTPNSPNPYGQVPAQPFGPPPSGQPPMPPPPSGAPRKPVPGWLWGLGGVLVASAVWAGTLFATGTLGGSGEEADLAGYEFAKNLCEAAEFDAFQERYEFQDSAVNKDNNRFSSRQDGLDQSQCSHTLKDPQETSSSYSSTYVYATAVWHKASDPAGEFADQRKAYEDQSNDSYSYEAKETDGLGDEAWFVTEQRGGKTDRELGGLTLSVREGWFTFEMRWSWYGSGDEKPPAASEVEKMLKTDTKAAMAELRK
ncbi:hypothetical protein [Streptomyces sp. SCSIO ZS0520]|uniref:hypothetical protein n=1 Tax=Streptomyces sp. SCSIO ZS0520 TaxID=2892996 RepID=UPI0021D8B54B|nr:hypothetical protein [Streptomyces sp. SCSIO ZS0520]